MIGLAHDPEFLRQRKLVILADLKMKIEAEDWHGVADAAMDLREVEAMLKVLPIPQGPRLPERPQDWEFSPYTGVPGTAITALP